MTQATLLNAAPVESGAMFSPCRTWRYALWRHWNWQGHANCVAFIGLNPSTADETKDDPTIRRCIGYAKAWGFGGLFMLNIFAFRATNPKDMRASTDPIGPWNDEILAYYRNCCGLLVAAWGAHGSFLGRDAQVKQVIGQRLDCLGETKSGQPKHPLYLRADACPQFYWEKPTREIKRK